MKEISRLREVTERGLSGLTADEALKQRIIAQAARTDAPEHSGQRRMTVGLLAAAAGLVLALVLTGGLETGRPKDAPRITQVAAGARSRERVRVGEKSYLVSAAQEDEKTPLSEDARIGEVGKGGIESEDLPAGTGIYDTGDGGLWAVTPDGRLIRLSEE